ncbi:CHAD domain-containing protein [Chitinophaga cymbidii]|uniref:CHAD domain-containing protein n=1 Tax=Chitinophaga cymbidii TaxID=1096750 RepID=A0A512RJF1_9BACT|nr:CHAD domain-containing protein [Chitinophaga cymbidii]GEP95818.1 hypothetical protein CCY01nite_20780 [Chitinophaga cymbidii]
MLKRKRQQKYLIKRWLEIRRQLYVFVGSGDQEALHRLRVEIKKIRAFTKFAESHEEKSAAAQLEKVRKIFRRAGLIREAGIHLQMMKQFNIDHPAFKNEELRIIDQESGKFRLRLTRYDKQIRHAITYLLKALHPIRNRAVKHWLRRQLKATAKIIVAPSTDKLHLARKKIKNVIYVHGMLHKRLVLMLGINTSYLDQLQEAIGKWHDTAIAVKLLISQNAGNKATINKLERERDKAGAAIHMISDGFWRKVFMASH